MDKQEQTFEEGLRELEEIIDQLESGRLSLEKSCELFERGMKILHFCQRKLEEIEKRVEILIKENDSVKLRHYDTSEIGEESYEDEYGYDEE
jgi:exodeoxyribonuclease VII small subunit